MINPTAIINKNTLKIAGYFVAIAALLGLAYWVYTQIKAYANKPGKVDLLDGPGNPNFDGGTNNTPTNSISNETLKTIALNLKNALYGGIWVAATTKNEAAKAAANLYDNDLIRLHKPWKTK
jgi:hypothetical protein